MLYIRFLQLRTFWESLFVTPVDFKGSATKGKAQASNGDMKLRLVLGTQNNEVLVRVDAS